MKLTNSQTKALNELTTFYYDSSPFHCLHGFAGSGKSTLIDYFVNTHLPKFKQLQIITQTDPRSIFMTATTNKAATINDSITIFKLLGLRIKNDTNSSKKVIDTSSIKNYINSFIIVDEYSMISEELFEVIKYFASLGNKFLFVGDSYQLPPIGKDQCVIKELPTSTLTEIVRQNKDNPIISLAQNIRDSIDKDSEISFTSNIVNNLGIAVTSNSNDFYSWIKQDYSDISSILTFTNKNVNIYNSFVRKDIEGFTKEYQIGDRIIVGSPVLSGKTVIYQNESEIIIKSISTTTIKSLNVYCINECIFTLIDPIKQSKLLKKHLAMYAATNNWKQFHDLNDSIIPVRHAYASTIHKSQGSTYDYVFIDARNLVNNLTLLNKKLLNVAVTRARYRAYLLV